MCLVGEGFEDSSDEVCGAVVQVRNKGDKMAIWTADAKKKDNVMQIGWVGLVAVVTNPQGLI